MPNRSEPARSADDHRKAGERIQPADDHESHAEQTLVLADLRNLPA